MSTGDARHGRRDNGLVAAEYAPAGDVDPRVGEHLLDVLALDGIAAYLRPSTDLHPVTRSTLLPSRPTDRLYVDRAHVATARDYLSRLAADAEQAEEAARTGEGTRTATPNLTGDEVEAAWAEIVAGYEVTAERGEGPPISPVPPAATPESRPTYYRLARATPAEEPSLLDGLDTFGADLPEDDNETFTPPVPPPVPRPSLPTALAVLGIVGGLAVFLQPELLSFLGSSLSMFLGFTAIVTGFGTLVWRLRPGDDEDDEDPEHGAKV